MIVPMRIAPRFLDLLLISTLASCLAALLVALWGCSSAKPTPQKEPIAITFGEFEAREGVTKPEAETIREAFATALQNTGRFVIVDRAQMAAVAAEREFQETQQGVQDQKTKSTIKSVRVILSGSVGKLGQDFIFNIKVTDIETTKVDFAVSKRFNGDLADVVDDLLPELADQVAQSMQERGH